MAKVYVEARPKGTPEEPSRAMSSRTTPTAFSEAIEWAKKREHRPLVARVKHLNDKNPDHWRAV